MSKVTKLPEPFTCPGCYSLDLYCDHANGAHGFSEFPHQFIGKSGAECRKQARRDGWRVHPDNTATCPKCTLALGWRKRKKI